MKWMKGMGLLLISNILIMVTLSLTVPILINVILPMFGIDVRGSVDLSTLVWAAMFGFGGAFISLAFSKQMARAMLDCQQITQPRSQAEHVIYGSVQEITQGLHINMPEVWVYDSPDPNGKELAVFLNPPVRYASFKRSQPIRPGAARGGCWA